MRHCKLVLPKVIWEEPRCHPSWREWTHLLHVLAKICAMTTADESNDSAAGTLHPHHSATCFLYVTLHCSIPPVRKKIIPSRWELPTPTGKNHPPAHLTHHPNGIIGVCTANSYCYYLCKINCPEHALSQCGINACTTRNLCYAKFSHGLIK